MLIHGLTFCGQTVNVTLAVYFLWLTPDRINPIIPIKISTREDKGQDMVCVFCLDFYASQGLNKYEE